ncbi:MAG: RluA family pseudouridine synthase [Ottowia sp.]|nr:RluA family pseudouridine synthase [Ottowia sp.]
MNELHHHTAPFGQEASPRADKVTHWVIDETHADQRIDNFLLKLAKGVPKSHIYRILRSGEVRVNRGRVDATYRLCVGDMVRLPPLRLAVRQTTVIPPALEFPILYEDESLLVIDKPAGVAVHGGSGVSYGVIEQLRRARPQAKFLELVHRLDRETSGILLLAKKRLALVALHEQMRNGEVDKRYLACVSGVFPQVREHLKFPLLKYHTQEGERRVRVQEDGQYAHTVVKRLEIFKQFSLLEAQLKTGRTHQIRVHLAHYGYPIVGDDKYGDFALNRELTKARASLGFRRMFLHAHRIGLQHPSHGGLLELEAPLSSACQTFLHHIRAEDERCQNGHLT